jgi:hypothetical protein
MNWLMAQELQLEFFPEQPGKCHEKTFPLAAPACIVAAQALPA